MRRINLMLGLCAAAALAALSGPATVQAQQAALSPAWPTRAAAAPFLWSPAANSNSPARRFLMRMRQRGS